MRMRASGPARKFALIGADSAVRAWVLEAVEEADVLIMPPSNPRGGGIGTILRVIPASARVAAKIAGGRHHPRRRAGARWPDACLTAIGVETSAQGDLELLRAWTLLNGWLVAEETPATSLEGRGEEARPLLMSSPEADQGPGGGRLSTWRKGGAVITISGVPGLPEIGFGDDIAGLDLAKAAPGLADGDVVVVTSKIVSRKAEDWVVRGDDNAAPSRPRPPAWWPGGVRQVISKPHYGLVMAAAGSATRPTPRPGPCCCCRRTPTRRRRRSGGVSSTWPGCGSA